MTELKALSPDMRMVNYKKTVHWHLHPMYRFFMFSQSASHPLKQIYFTAVFIIINYIISLIFFWLDIYL